MWVGVTGIVFVSKQDSPEEGRAERGEPEEEGGRGGGGGGGDAQELDVEDLLENNWNILVPAPGSLLPELLPHDRFR